MILVPPDMSRSLRRVCVLGIPIVLGISFTLGCWNATTSWAVEATVDRAAVGEESATAETLVDFAGDIRPILSDHCFACHGPDEGQRAAGVRIDTAGGLAEILTAG